MQRISKSTALNLFRKFLHITPINYLIHYRLNEAALLLSKTEKKINAISYETGFNNVDYFCRLFKKHYDLTPTEYRKKKSANL
ncbi:MAG: helix-turn-helix transcriptional regulator [Enterocloster sp.]